MSRQVQQNLLRTSSTGEVAAVFPGGVQMTANNVPDFGVSDRHVTWRRQSDGSLVASIGGRDLAGVASTLALTAVEAPNSPFAATVSAEITDSTGTEVFGVQIIDSQDRSHFLRFADGYAPDTVRVKFGSITYTGVGAGSGFLPNITMPWTVYNLGLAILSVTPTAAYGFTLTPRVVATNLTLIAYNDNPTPQDMTIIFVAYGY